MSDENEDIEGDDSETIDDDESENQGEDADESSSKDDKGEGDESDDSDEKAPEGDDSEDDDDETDDDESEDPNELKEKLRKSNESKDRIFRRMKEAQGFVPQKDSAGKIVRDAKGKIVWVKSNKKKPESSTTVPAGKKSKEDLTFDDMHVLIEAKVPREDVQDVKDYAKLKGISISKALNSKTLQTILREKAEERSTSNATHSGSSRRGTNTPSGSSLLRKARETGELPSTDEGMRAMADERYKQK